jgi:putative peptide zinc metalloprotease protein
MKDKATNWYYEIDAFQYFLLSKMDGHHTLAEIKTAVESRYSRSLSEHAWQELFKQIDHRQLLADHVNNARLEELVYLNKRKRHSEHQTLLRHSFPLSNPDNFLGKILPWVRFAFHPFFVISALLALAIQNGYVLLNLPSLLSEVWNSRTEDYALPLYTIYVAMHYIIPLFHETAHGLTCKRFGGSVKEMGVIWRFLSFFPYCKLDDITLFHNRWHRVYAAFAGTFCSMLFQLPFGVLWFLTPQHTFLHSLSALMLTLYNLTTLINFIPFVELDGYFMLAHTLNMPDLRRASNEFWTRKMAKLLFKQEEVAKHAHHFGPQRARLYFYYGIASISLTTLFMFYFSLYWFISIYNIVGGFFTWLLAGLLGIYLLFRLYKFFTNILALRQPDAPTLVSSSAHKQAQIADLGARSS